MSEPTVTCALCGRSQAVVPSGRGFPPDTAKRKLRKICQAGGCSSDPQYRAGFIMGGRATGQESATE